jgi:DNA-directed RNA polymerase beta' subunit
MKDGKITAAPLTNKDIMHMSNGEIKEPLMLSVKNLTPETGGLFDTSLTGGLKGTRWTHYGLAEPIANPVFERPMKSILGLNTNEFNGIAEGSIGVKKGKDNKFHLHDILTGNHIRTVDMSKPI